MRFTSSIAALAAAATTLVASAGAFSFDAPSKDAALQQRGPVLPLRPIAQAPFDAASFIVGGELADAETSKFAVALVTNSRVRSFIHVGSLRRAPIHPTPPIPVWPIHPPSPPPTM